MIAQYEFKNSKPVPEIFERNNPSPPIHALSEPCVETSSPTSPAKYAPPWARIVSPVSSNLRMSPGADGARTISPL